MAGTPVSRIPSRKPSSSSTVTPRICNAVSSAVICSLGNSLCVIPIRICFISSRESSSWFSILLSISFIDCAIVVFFLALTSYYSLITFHIYKNSQFCSIFFPSGVRTLSGWNWIPLIFWVLWRSAIICPSSLSAVISRQSGKSSFETTHE